MLQLGEIQEFRWIENRKQVANSLTKAGASTDYLLNILRYQMKFNLMSVLEYSSNNKLCIIVL